MKKILTTTVITAILATSGFAASNEPVDYEVYDTANFPSGTDVNDTTIMPSGTVNVGKSGETPVIESKWTLQEGSTMNVTGNGFCLTKTLEINPKDDGIPVKCNLKNDGNLYYQYSSEALQTVYSKLVGEGGSATGLYLDANGDALPGEQPNDSDFVQAVTEAVTGIPQIAANDATARANAVIDMAYKAGPVTTTLPSDAKVVTYETTSIPEAVVECDLSQKESTPQTFYVYCGKFNGTETEVYSTRCYPGESINTLWDTSNVGYSMFQNEGLGSSKNIYVCGVPSSSGLDKNYYTQLGGCLTYGLPDMTSKSITDVSLKRDTVQGCISGGTVTYTKSGSATISNDTASNLVDTSLGGITGSQFVIGKATSDGFTEKYLENLPTLKYTDGNGVQQELTVTATSSYTNGELSGTGETLETYLNSFGFYPKTVTVSGQTGLELIAGKTSNDAVLVPADYEFKQSANTATHTIATNLHNTDKTFTSALKFTGEGATTGTMDTLVFSGDNSNLKPECGVTYKDVKVTFEKAESWIAPTNEAVTFETTGGNTSTVTVCENLEICSDLNVREGVSVVGPKDTTIKLFGTVTFGDDGSAQEN